VTVTIGLAGAGHRAAGVHAPSLASLPGARFAGIWAPRAQAASALADKHAVDAYEHFGDMLDHCDAVVFAVPPAAQPDLASLAAGRGKAVLLEIPIAGDLAGAEELAEAIATAGVVSQIALTWRYASAVRRFLETSVPRTRPLGGSGRGAHLRTRSTMRRSTVLVADRWAAFAVGSISPTTTSVGAPCCSGCSRFRSASPR